MSENIEKSVVEKADKVDNDKNPKAVKTDKKKKEKKPRKHPFGEMVSELKKVSWPTKADLRTYTACVLLFVVVCAALLALMDLGVGKLIELITTPEGLPGVLNGWFGA